MREELGDWQDDELCRVTLIALATFADDDLATERAGQVLAVLADPGVHGSRKAEVVVAMQPHRLSTDGVRKAMEAILKGCTAANAPALPRMVTMIATARRIEDQEIRAWAEKLDTCAGTSGNLLRVALSVRKRIARHD